MKKIKGHNGYRIDIDGTIYGRRGKIIKQRITNQGYLRVFIRNNKNKQVHRLVHRLVAEAFLPNPDNLPIVMHLDDNKLNPHVSNLKWSNQSENISEAYRKGRLCPKKGKDNHMFGKVGEKAHNSKLSDKDRPDIIKGYMAGVKRKDLALRYNVTKVRIHQIIKNL